MENRAIARYIGLWATGWRGPGIGVAIPSYRLMPQNPHPAQIEDAAAAFAWVVQNIAQHGGDASRIYLSGHSAGAHLAALLALDEKYLGKFGLPRTSIRGVIAMSGIYDVDKLDTFLVAADNGDKHDASPVAHAHSGSPPFLISYCQWDYFGLPKQARDFTIALKKNFVPAQLLYVPNENHISEVISLVQDHGLLIDAILNAVNNGISDTLVTGPAFDLVGVGLNATDTLLLVPKYPELGGKVAVRTRNHESRRPGGQRPRHLRQARPADQVHRRCRRRRTRPHPDGQPSRSLLSISTIFRSAPAAPIRAPTSSSTSPPASAPSSGIARIV